MRTEQIFEERIARFVELAEQAQEAATRAQSESLQVSYIDLAAMWLGLAKLAQQNMPPPVFESEYDGSSRRLD